MGGKFSRKGKYLYLCATFMTVLLAGCVAVQESGRSPKTEGLFSRGYDLFQRGDLKGALKAFDSVIRSPDTGGQTDKALFYSGLIHVHFDNPDKDYKKSREYFKKLIRERPGSELSSQARIWIDVLGVIEQSTQVDIEIEKKMKELTGEQ